MKTNLIVASQTKLKSFVTALKEGLQTSSGAKSQSTYYHKKEDQEKATVKAVEALYNIDKSLPLLLASMGDSTYFYRQTVLLNEFKNGYDRGPVGLVNSTAWFENGLQEKIVSHIMSTLPITYILRMFLSIKGQKINGYRARGKMVKWLLANINDFTAVKYGDKMKEALIHAWGKSRYVALTKGLHDYLNGNPCNASELNKWIFTFSNRDNAELAKFILFIDGTGKKEWYDTFKYTKAYFALQEAGNDTEFYEAAKLLDFNKVVMMLGSPKNPYFRTLFGVDKKLKAQVKAKLLENSTVMTDETKTRTKELQKKTGANVRQDIDYSKVSTQALYKTEGLESQKAVRVKAQKLTLPYNKAIIIWDKSISNRGGSDSKNTAAVTLEHLKAVLVESIPHNIVVETPETQTDLTKPLIEGLSALQDADVVFVLSDGYENYPYDGCFSEMVEKICPEKTVIHCAPYTAAEMNAQARSLGANVTSLPVTEPAQLQVQMEVQMLDLNPEKYFEKQFEKFLSLNEKIMLRSVNEVY